MGQLDSALVYTLKGQSISETIKDYFGLADGYINLASIYKAKNQYALAYDYSVTGKKLADSLNEAYITRLMQFQNLSFDQKNRLLELERKDQEEKTRIRMYALGAALFTFLLVALLLYRNNRLKQRTNKILEGTLSDLKATQNQLIQSEKMASLGELTAGIAHEIQNPLNFVNNFSEVNKELAEELEQEVDKGNTTEVKALAKDIKENQEKILHHGKRADAIVKGMLQHSRSTSGTKEPTDINALADEYLRLAYHGLRAKDKSFNATMKTESDETIGNINIIPQDIGRVILNLITNAFYAVNEKYKAESSKLKAEGEKSSYAKASENKYEPTVSVSTRKEGNKVLISVKDNGPGIPEHIKEKIFQPFFTTKPTGQGTGLGLSLSYDIVKAHGGELRVETKEGVGSEFIISLPLV
ncbi:MAG: GHKL domain-containing protein [Cyclobacteriaceae bacterium]|nr:GHKL domain-containing protein [Cyclobacteriaceae bacterium]